jgi:hypothetical protein
MGPEKRVAAVRLALAVALFGEPGQLSAQQAFELFRQLGAGELEHSRGQPRDGIRDGRRRGGVGVVVHQHRKAREPELEVVFAQAPARVGSQLVPAEADDAIIAGSTSGDQEVDGPHGLVGLKE